MKKILRYMFLLIIFLSVFLIFKNNIKAEYSGTGGTGSGSVSGIGNEGSWNSTFGFYIKVYDKNDKKWSTVDVDVGSYSNPKIAALKGWISKSGDTWTSNPNILYSYLGIPYGSTSGDYSTLLSKINVSLNVGDYITIEPYTKIGSSKYTFREISDSSEKYTKCIEKKCTAYKCAKYKQTCKTRSKTECETYSSTCKTSTCTKYKCKTYKCIKKGFLGIRCKERSKTECEKYSTTCETSICNEFYCTTYKCTEYKNTSTCETYSSTCETYSNECAKTEDYSYYVWYAKPAVILANAAKVGSNITAGGKTFTASSSSCTSSSYGSKKFCGYSSNKNIGYGITVVRYSDIYKAKVHIAYHPNGGTVNSGNLKDGWIYYNNATYFHTIKHGESGDPYNANNTETFNLRRPGYTFVGWKVKSTGKILDQNTKYHSTVYAQYDDATKTTANADTVYCQLIAQWEADGINVIYHGKGGYTNFGDNEVTDYVYQGSDYAIRGSELFKRNNYAFVGWTTKANGEADGYGWTGRSGNWTYRNGQYGISNNELHLYAMWKDSCIYELEQNPSPLKRIELYQTYTIGTQEKKKKRNLLNFDIFEDAEEACGDYMPSYGTSNSCLSIDQVNNTTENKFSSSNLSDYNDTISSSSTQDVSYCLTDFELEKTTEMKYNSNTIVKAGRMVFDLKQNYGYYVDPMAIGTLTKTCYIHKNVYGNYSDITKDNFIKIEDYIGTATLNGVIVEEVKSEPSLNSVLDGDFYKVTGSVSIGYKPASVYVEKITGKPCTISNSDNNYCRFLGNGIVSNFEDAKLRAGETYKQTPEGDAYLERSFKFSITSPISSTSKNIFSFETGICPYKVAPEIIKYNTEKGNLDIEFRIVDTNNPFNRTTKSNWSSGTDNSKNNEIVKQNITNDSVNNSYNRTGEGSLYTNQTDGTKRIILTPDIVKKIREYNDGTGTGDCANSNPSYDDYTVYTVTAPDGTKTTTSNFFKCIGLTKTQ